VVILVAAVACAVLFWVPLLLLILW